MTAKKNDLRNVKQTQFDRAQVLKGSFSELNSGLRTVPTNAILRDVYTHFSQTVNAGGQPTDVTYYQANVTAIDQITFTADVSQSLAGTYIVLEEFLTKKTHVFYYVVSGSGTAPGVGDIETAINIATNDPASVVCYSTKLVLDTVEDFTVTAKNLVANNLTLEYYQFGETSAIDTGTTGFFVTRIQEGDSKEVGSVSITYTAEGDPIYNGNTLKGLIYNPYTASFESSGSAANGSILYGVKYDYFTTTLPSSTQTAYTYKFGGASGATVAVVTVTFTDSSKCEILTVEKT